MNWRKTWIFAGLYLTMGKIPEYLKEIEGFEKLPQEEVKINRGNFEANLIFLKKTRLLTKDQKINSIGRTTSKTELKELVDKGLFEVRSKGKGTRYVLSMTIR